MRLTTKMTMLAICSGGLCLYGQFEGPYSPQDMKAEKERLQKALADERSKNAKVLTYLAGELRKYPGSPKLMGQSEAYQAKDWHAIKAYHEGLEDMVTKVSNGLKDVLRRALQRNPQTWDADKARMMANLADLESMLGNAKTAAESSGDKDEQDMLLMKVKFLGRQITAVQADLARFDEDQKKEEERKKQIGAVLLKLDDEATQHRSVAKLARDRRDNLSSAALRHFRQADLEDIWQEANRATSSLLIH